MGQKHSIETLTPATCRAPSYADPWSLMYTDTVDSWHKCAAGYGFADYPYGCVDRDCDRDSVCLKRARAVLKRHSHSFEIRRFHKPSKTVSYGDHAAIRERVSSGFQLNEVVAAMNGDCILIILYRWERLQYESTFVYINLATCKILCLFEAPSVNMSIMECRISPDGRMISVLFYLQHNASEPFRYDLYVYSTETKKLADIIHCNEQVRPYVTFDPRYKMGRIAVVNYTNESEKLTNSLVLYCLKTHKIIAVSHVMLSIIYGGATFCINYSRGGDYLILQKISDNMNGVHCYADSYVFDSNNLKLLKHYYANLQAFSTLCCANYAPVFSQCGSRMCLVSEEGTGNQKKLLVSVYQLPRPLNLQAQCRTVILQNVASVDLVKKLPLPTRLKEFVAFQPQL